MASLRALRPHLPLLLILAAISVIALPVLTYPLGRDQGEFATIGRGILAGRVPYVDLWNPKPPAVFYLYALAMALFGQTTGALRALDLLLVPAMAGALYVIGIKLGGRSLGAWAALVFAAFYYSETFWTLTQNDGLVLLPMTLALACAFQASEGGRRAALWAGGSGALYAWALWFKYPFVLLIVPLAAAFAPPARTWLRLVPAFIVGVLGVGLGGAAYLAALGALPALIESARVTSSYTALGFNPADFAAAMQTALGFRLSHWGLLFALALLWLPLRERSSARPGGWRVVWLWVLAALVMMLVQARGYDYHWLPLLAPLALLAAGALDGLAQRLGGRWVTAVGVLALLAIPTLNIWPRALPYLTGREDQVTYYGRFQAGEFVADESLRVANFLRERVAPGDSLFIWGFRPEVYYLSALTPAVRFIFQFPLVADWYPGAWKEETVDILWAALPPYVLVLQVDYMPWVTGRDDDSNTLLQEYVELNDWLIYNYERDTQIGNFFIWRRKS